MTTVGKPRWSLGLCPVGQLAAMCVVGNCSAPTSEAVKHYIMNKKTKTNTWSSRQPVSRQFPLGCGLYIFPSHGNIRLYPVHHVCDVWRGLGGDLS